MLFSFKVSRGILSSSTFPNTLGTQGSELRVEWHLLVKMVLNIFKQLVLILFILDNFYCELCLISLIALECSCLFFFSIYMWRNCLRGEVNPDIWDQTFDFRNRDCGHYMQILQTCIFLKISEYASQNLTLMHNFLRIQMLWKERKSSKPVAI